MTHVANRCATTTVTEDGTTTTVLARDSEAVRPPRIVRKSRACSSPARVEMQKLHVLPPRSRDTAAASWAACAEHRRSNRSQAPRVPAEIEVAKHRRVQIIAKRHVEAIEDEVRTAKWLSSVKPALWSSRTTMAMSGFIPWRTAEPFSTKSFISPIFFDFR